MPLVRSLPSHLRMSPSAISGPVPSQPKPSCSPASLLECLSHTSASAGFVSIVPDEEKGVLIHLDRSKVLTVGVPAIEAYLRKIQVYKSTADYAAYVLREDIFRGLFFVDRMKPRRRP